MVNDRWDHYFCAMSRSMKIALVMSAIAIGLKLGLFAMGVEQRAASKIVMAMHLFLILGGTFFGVRGYVMDHPDAAVKDRVKAGMRVGGIYALIISVFVFCYYQYIDTTYFPEMIANRIELAKSAMVENPDINLENVKKTGEMFFNPKVHATITLFGLVVTGVIYSVLITFFMKQMIAARRGR